MFQLLFQRFSLRPEYSWREFEAINASIPWKQAIDTCSYTPCAVNWTKAQREPFLNDFDILLVVYDSVNQSKSGQAPHEWLPPNKGYWCNGMDACYPKRHQCAKVVVQ